MTYLGAAGCGYWVYASSGDAAVLASESCIGIVGINGVGYEYVGYEYVGLMYYK